MQLKLFFALTFLLLLNSCSKEGDIIICHEGTEGLLLDRIENRMKIDTSTILYFYNQLNLLDSMVHKLRNGESQYKFFYDADNKLIAKRTSLLTILPIKKSRISGIDSFTYNSKNQIIKHRSFAKSDTGYILQNTSSYFFNNENLLEKIISGRDNDTSSILISTWKDGNIIKTASFSKDMILEYEFFYSYDNFKNPFSKHSKFSHLANSKNNAINVKTNDFSGKLLELEYFRPREMCYNSDGFLTKLINFDGEISYFYRNP